MADEKFVPYVPAQTDMPELTVRALVLGLVMAVVLGASMAYVGMRAGMTIAATFPAAVIAMAAMRIFKGSILEENIARTTASVGEGLVAGVIFTLPAFLISGLWDTLHYWESTILMLVGGVMGILFVIVLRRSLIEEADLQFPEAIAAAEIVKAGQKGSTGARYVFGAAGIAALLELLKNNNGLKIFEESKTWFLEFSRSKIQLVGGNELEFGGGIQLMTPAAAPTFMGVGYIIGPKLAALTFSGGVISWLLLIPLILFFNGSLETLVAGGAEWTDVASSVWYNQVRPLAVGTMLVGAFYTLFKLRGPLASGIGRAVSDMKKGPGEQKEVSRLDKDLDYRKIFIAIGIMLIPMFFVFNYFAGDLGSALVATITMAVAGFFFAAVAGFLVGLIGSSSNPISGLTLTTLLITALLMVAMGNRGDSGILAVLAVATVVCCAAGLGGDMMQDLKVGQILGGTPWRMQVGELIGVVVAAFVLVIPINILHQTTVGGIGGEVLPAPQAGLMALMAKGIVSGDMIWPLVIIGMLFGLALIMLNTPSPMIIAVGMYLPYPTTFAIFIGGMFAWWLKKLIEQRTRSEEDAQKATNTGILLASGLVAGEALMGVILAGILIISGREPTLIEGNPYLGFLVFPIVGYILLRIPIRRMLKEASSSPVV